MQIYLVGNSVRVSFKWVVLISTKQEAAHTQSAKVSTCYTLVTNYGEGVGLQNSREGGGGASEVLPLQIEGGERKQVLAVPKGGGGCKKF